MLPKIRQAIIPQQVPDTFACMYILNQHPGMAGQLLATLRDVNRQQNRAVFRQHIEILGTLLAAEICKTLPQHQETVKTPLGLATEYVPALPVVCATVLRAGLPLHAGMLSLFTEAESAFVGAARGAHRADHSFDIQLDYVACPDLNGKCLIVADPMLATGKSLVKACEALLQKGTPAQLHLACVLGSPQGVAYVQHHLPQANLWLAALDQGLNEHAYIVPGLGDAGDLSFGEKM